MKVTYVGNTERNGKKRKVTYTGTLGPSAAQDRRGPKATYVGVDTSKGFSDGVAWHTDKASMQANKEYFAGKKNENQNNFTRAGKTVTGGLKGSLAGNMDAMGVAYQAGQGGRTQRNTAALKDAQWAVSRAKYAYDTDKTPSSAAELDNALKQLKAYADVLGDGAYEQALKAAYDASGRIGTADLNKLYESLGKVNVDTSTGLQQKATRATRDLALQVQQSGSRDIEAAKEGVGTFGQMVIDTGASMAQMGGDLAVNALLGTPGSMMPFATRAFGGATMQAREGGGDLKQQIAYGAVQAGKEVLTEKMFNMALPFAKAYGGGALDDVTQRAIQTAVDKLGKTAAGKRTLNAALQLTASGVGEGLEELIGDWMEWQMPRIYGGDVDTAGETLANSLYDFVVGGMAGVAGSVISPDTYSYGRYAADVQQNTAPEMNDKAAEAVEAVTRGETITGNQAAAIARDPVAVEVLEQRTGVKLDTDKPISQVKRDIAGLASREAAQETQRATPPSPAVQKRAEKRVGGFLENGQKAYQEMSRTAEDAPSLYAGFSSVYNAGLNGIEADKAKGKYAATLTPEQRYAAYNAGLEDARAQVARENAEVASVTTTAGAGLADNEYSRYLIAAKKDTAATLNTWGKKLGVRIEIVDQVLGGRANGQYIKEQNLIQIAADSGKPLLNVTAHEITHRMQDLSPAEYRKFRQSAVEYKMRENGADTEAEIVERYMETAEQEGVTLTRDEVMDELAADFAGDMLDNADLFAKFSKENRTAAQKLLDSLKEFLAKVKTALTGKYRDMAAQEAYGKDFAELEDIAKQWQAAFDAAERQAEKAKTAAGKGDGVRFSLKSFSEQAVSTALYDALNEKATRQNQLIPVSIMPRYISEKLGINGDIYIQRDHAYENMVSKAQAIQDGRPTQHKGAEVHFHDLGVEKMTRAIMSINEPIMTISTKTKDGNPAVIMMLPEYGNNDAPLYAVLSFYSRKAISPENREMRPHVVLTIAERNFFENGGRVGWDKLIRNAIKDGRVLDYNKKERGNLSEVAQPAGLGDITDASLKENLAQFQKEVKRFKESNNIRYQLRSAAEVEQEMRDLKRERTVLASRNRVLEQRVQELKGEMRISKEPSVVARDVKKLGQNLIREYGSDVKYADVQNEMDALAKAVMKRDVTMEDLMPHAKAVAEAIVDNTSELTEYGAELLEIRDYLKRQTIQFGGDMANYGDFRKSHMGTLKLNKSNGTSVDTVYGELAEMFGEGYFPSDVYKEADKLLQIGDVLDGLDSVYHNPFEGYRDAAVQEIANQLVDGMISDQVRQKKTYADRRALEKQEAVGRVREMLSRERQKRRDDVKALRKKYNEKTKEGSEKRKATAMRARIARHTGAISRKLVNPTDKQHIPERLRVVVASLLQNINLESAYSYDENGRLRKNADGDPTRRTLEADRLKQIYDDILDNEGNMVVDPALTESGGLLDTLAGYGDKRIADMSYSELETVWNAIRAVERTLTSYDRTLSNGNYESTSKWAQTIADGSMGRMRRDRKLSLDMADPYTFFSAYGEGGMQVYRTLRDAQDREHMMLLELRNTAGKFLDSEVYKNRNERHTFTTGWGQELTLTTGQIMNLYNLARRGEQAMNHLTVGGIVQPEIARDGKLKAIPRGNENIPLTLEDIQAITKVLTTEQKKVADGLQKLASSKLAQWGNEASMQVYGYRKFKEEHYWPIQTAKETTASSVEKGPEMAKEIKNMGSAKALTPNATNALDIGSVYDVFAQNASDMIKYATLLAPMEDINRLYNFRYRDRLGNLTGKNVRQVLSGVYGDAAQTYWRNLMRDVQNGMKKSASATTRAVERLVGNTKSAAVGANLRVVIQQPTAYFRAAVVLDPAYMTKGLVKGVTAGNGWDKARKYAPIAGIKDTSGFDQGGRYTIAREVYGTDGGFMEKLNDWSSKGAAWADAVTWGKIWNACEWQVAENTKLEVGSDAYYKQVAAVFTDVIDQTQVVDGIMQRTQIMRDSDALTRQATSFMGEPLKSLNILMRTYDAWRYETSPQKRSTALKQMKRAVGALLVTDVVNALAQSIVDGLRDDDKDKKYWELVLEAFTGITGEEKDFGEVVKNIALQGNVKGNITLVGRIPYAKDIISILQGYTVDRMDAGAVDDIVKATKSIISSANGEGKKTVAYNGKQFLTVVSKIFGVSVANLGRDTWAIARSIASETGNIRVMFEMEKAIYRMDKSAGNRKTWCALLYRAQKENDTETARLIYKEMLEHGYEEKDVRQGVEAIMKTEQKVKSVDDLKNRWRAP